VGQAIVLHYARIGDGDVGGALLKTGVGIAARFKKCVDQVVGFGDGGAGMVDKARLDGLPLGYKTIPLGWAELSNLQGLDAGFTVG